MQLSNSHMDQKVGITRLCLKPAAWVESVAILAEDMWIAMKDPRVDTEYLIHEPGRTVSQS